MSTRCQIGFYPDEKTDLKKWEALIYRHSDGYPDGECGVLQTIAPLLQKFNEERGLEDIEYASAWLVAQLKTDYFNIGISNGLHGNIEYFYRVCPTSIRVFNCYGGEKFSDMREQKKWRLTPNKIVNA